MPSSVGHAAVAVIASPIVWNCPRASRLVAMTALLVTLPDLDAIGRPFGLGDVELLGGHRAFTHSIFAAFGVAAGVAYAWRRGVPAATIARVFAFVFIVMMSHGLLDMLTQYGSGVALFSPVSATYFVSPWRPFAGILPEMLALWLPAIVMLAYIKRIGALKPVAVAGHAR